MTDKLTAKQEAFCNEYLIDLNATQAAIRAGYSAHTARAIGSENLTKPDIIAALNERRRQLAEATDVTPERILKEYARIGFFDPRSAVRWRSNILTEAVDPDTGEAAGVHTTDVELIDSDELSDDAAAAIAEIGKDSRGGLKIKFHDKRGALDAMARTLDMFHPESQGGDVHVHIHQMAKDF